MAPKVLLIILFIFVHPVISEIYMVNDIRLHKAVKSYDCHSIRPAPKLIVKSFNSILPFFATNHMNSGLLQKFQALILSMFEGTEYRDREAAFYAVVLTPLIFLHKYKDSWCLIEKFHDSLRIYQRLSIDEKEKYLKKLQNVRALSQKIGAFIFNFPSNPAGKKEDMDSAEAEYEMELQQTTLKAELMTKMEIWRTAIPFEDRKKFDLNLHKEWSPGITAVTSRAPAGPDKHDVNNLLRNFIMHQTSGQSSSQEKKGQDSMKFVKQLMKSLG